MAHVTKMLEPKILSNGQISIGVQCCGDPRHISWRTLDTAVAADSQKLQQAEDALRSQVCGEHAAEQAAVVLLANKVGVEKTH